MRQFVLDRMSPLPLHLQVQQGIERDIERGIYVPGNRLPTVQEFAQELKLSTHTVMRAYSELCRRGVLEAKRGSGTFVAGQRQVTTLMLLPSWISSPAASVHDELIGGLRRVLGESDRRFSSMHIEGGNQAVREVIGICQAQHADTVVVFDPSIADEDHLPLLCDKVPSVALLCQKRFVHVMDSVDVDPRRGLRKILQRRIAAGQRRFVYVGMNFLMSDSRSNSAYSVLFDEFNTMMAAAGITPQIELVTGSAADREVATRTFAATLPEGSTILAMTPQTVEGLEGAGKTFDIITYTESHSSRTKLQGRVAVLHLSLTDAAAHAGQLLIDRKRAGANLPPRQVMLSAEVLDT